METVIRPIHDGIKDLQPFRASIVKEAEKIHNEKRIIRLAFNENPYGPSEQVVQTIANTLSNIEQYPDGTGTKLKLAIANKYQVKPEQITLGCGSDNIFSLLTSLFLNKSTEAIISQYAFAAFAIAIKVAGAKCVTVPAVNWGNDLTGMVKAVTNKTRLIFIANPNNPTGTWFERSALIKFLDQVPDDILVTLDEAYCEYVAGANCIDSIRLLEKYPNLIITRTFSKIYGLAGLRVGYSISSVYLADLLNKVRLPYNVNKIALIAAEIALNDKQHISNSIIVNNSEKARFIKYLDELNLNYIPSAANFLTIKFGDKTDDIYQKLLQEGIFVMSLKNYDMQEYLRVSIGKTEDNNYFMQKLKNMF